MVVVTGKPQEGEGKLPDLSVENFTDCMDEFQL